MVCILVVFDVSKPARNGIGSLSAWLVGMDCFADGLVLTERRGVDLPGPQKGLVGDAESRFDVATVYRAQVPVLSSWFVMPGNDSLYFPRSFQVRCLMFHRF